MVDITLGIPLPGQPLPGQQPPDTDRYPRLRVIDRFILGPENQLAEAAIRSLLSDSADPYNPLVFYGPPGTGKTHLARGLADVWKIDLRRSVLYVVASDFARDLTDALETNALQEFRAVFVAPHCWWWRISTCSPIGPGPSRSCSTRSIRTARRAGAGQSVLVPPVE